MTTINDLAEEYGLDVQDVQAIPWIESLVDKADEEPPTPRVEWFGQDEVIDQVRPFLHQTEPFPHTLILGVPGIGKTHLARWIAQQERKPFREVLCPVTPDQIPKYGIVLLDECHKQRNPEPLFRIMEKRQVTLLGATTRPENLDAAFKSRFFLTLNLTRYNQHSMETLISNIVNSKAQGSVSEEWISVLARASGGNPRQALRLVATARGVGSFDPALVLPVCRITADGLTDLHVRYLQALARMGRPTGVSQLAIVMYSDEQSVKEAERLLLDYRLISLSSSGRTLTPRGIRYVELLEDQNGRE